MNTKPKLKFRVRLTALELDILVEALEYHLAGNAEACARLLARLKALPQLPPKN